MICVTGESYTRLLNGNKKTINMKTIKPGNSNTSILCLAVVLFISLSLASCAKKIRFSTSTVVPAAQGSVKVKKDNNNNYNIDLSIIRLADPQRLTPPKNSYAVWIETEQNGTKNIGGLNTSGSLLSKTLKSSLKTVTPFKPTRIFITAEDNTSVQYPGSQVVLTTERF